MAIGHVILLNDQIEEAIKAETKRLLKASNLTSFSNLLGIFSTMKIKNYAKSRRFGAGNSLRAKRNRLVCRLGKSLRQPGQL